MLGALCSLGMLVRAGHTDRGGACGITAAAAGCACGLASRLTCPGRCGSVMLPGRLLPIPLLPTSQPRVCAPTRARAHTLNALRLLRPVCAPQVYALLEGEFNPLQLCRKISPLLDSVEALPAALSPASPVAEVALAIYKPYLQQVGL